MKRLWNFLFKKKSIPLVVESPVGKCKTCRFADWDNSKCTAGSYWAEQGYNKICFEGELWESK